MTPRSLLSATVLLALLLAACGAEEARAPVLSNLDAALAQPFEAGDVLVSINGRPVRSRAEATAVMKTTAQDAAPWKVVIDRRGRRIELDVHPGR